MGRPKEGVKIAPVVVPEDLAETLKSITDRTGIRQAEIIRRALRFAVATAWDPSTRIWRGDLLEPDAKGDS